MSARTRNYLGIGFFVGAILMIIAIILFWTVMTSCGCSVNRYLNETRSAIEKTNATVETAIINTQVAKTMNAVPNSWPTVTQAPRQ
jgi:hypothetical protein